MKQGLAGPAVIGANYRDFHLMGLALLAYAPHALITPPCHLWKEYTIIILLFESIGNVHGDDCAI